MIFRITKVLSLLIILLHFMGVTQYMSSFAKNQSSFLSMMTIAEEESKKEKDDKDFTEDTQEFRDNNYFRFTDRFRIFQISGFSFLLEHYPLQYIAEQLTPPPNANSY